jgi:flagellar basal-body rod protein FlgG
MRINYSLSQTGIQAQQLKMDQISNDIANVNTTGYKSKSTSFRELLLNDVTERDVLLSDGAIIGQSRGVQSGVTGTNFSSGNIVETGQPYHFAINGNGFFQVTSPEGNQYLTRDGAFTVDSGGNLVNDRGHYVTIQGDLNGEFTIPLFTVDNPQSLQPISGNYFEVPAGTGMISSQENPGIFGSVAQGMIENSNVDLAQAMTEMIVAQRAYSLNIQASRSTDEMYQVINNLNR